MFKAFFIRNKLVNNDEFDHLLHFYVWYRIAMTSVADPDPGSGIGVFLTPGSGIRNRFIPDPGSQTHIFESLVTTF